MAEVITFTRAFADPAVSDAYETPYERLGLHSSIERLPFGPDGYLPTADHWPFRARIEQELERSLQRHGGLDVVHLRFADAGTFAAARVCRRLGIPVVFTLAPDPHAVLREAEAAGDLSRESFAASDLEHHYLFRARLVDWMLHHADALALLPRAGGERELQALLGTSFHLTRHRRARTIAEGIATRAPGPTGHQVPGRKGAGRPAAVEALAAAIERLPAARHRLPLLVTVGRLHRVKGLPLLVDAWSGDPELFSAFNLVVVGGDLERPTVEEQAVLDEIGAVCGHAAHAHDGLVLLGHRPHGDVPRLLDAAMHGIPGLVAAGGVYACASRKEEFGLALLEALAAGLSAVGPRSGGPPTYIDDGRTGFLADTTSVEGLRSGLRRAAVARLDEARAARSRRLVTERFTVTSMAAELVALYADVTDSSEVEAA